MPSHLSRFTSSRADTNIEIYASLYAGGHQTFEASKVCKNARQYRYVPFHRLSLIKKTVALRFACYCKTNVYAINYAKPPRLRFGSANCSFVLLFF